jgi:drug/metabolite transporter (DMT)-like permease
MTKYIHAVIIFILGCVSICMTLVICYLVYSGPYSKVLMYGILSLLTIMYLHTNCIIAMPLCLCPDFPPFFTDSFNGYILLIGMTCLSLIIQASTLFTMKHHMTGSFTMIVINSYIIFSVITHLYIVCISHIFYDTVPHPHIPIVIGWYRSISLDGG